MDAGFYCIDVLGVSRALSWFLIFIKWGSTHPLTHQQISIARRVFHDALDYGNIYVDDKARIGLHKWAHAYVSFRIINCKDKLRDDVFIHELVHAWQYQNFGSMYIGRALVNHTTQSPYDYGGIEVLYEGMIAGKQLIEFTFEQQGEIIQHYYAIEYMRNDVLEMHRSIYRYYASQLVAGSYA